MIESVTISKQPPAAKSMDYNFLRSEGMKYIEKLSSKIWTDYNTHDPGITILEALCYAITDLGYRINYDIADILSGKANNDNNFRSQFLTALKILPSAPVTENDYRKLFIDIEGLKNAWLTKVQQTIFVDCNQNRLSFQQPESNKQSRFNLNGLYNILIESDKQHLSDEDKAQLLGAVKQTYHKNRNLCEDLITVDFVPEHEIIVCADIEINAEYDANEIYAEVLFRLEQYLSPSVNFYSLQEMLDKQKQPDEIFNGPVLNHGFIDDDELINSSLRTNVYTSDIINFIMNIDGVLAVKKIILNYCESADQTSEAGFGWCIKIKDGFKAVLCTNKTNINFYKDVIPVITKAEIVTAKLDAKNAALVENASIKKQDDLALPQGNFRDAGNYSSVTKLFPATYGIGDAGLPANVSEQRRAQAKQLKAYLFFFDQLLANYMQQLARVQNLFLSDDTIKQTYFVQSLKSVKNIEELFLSYSTIETFMHDALEDQDEYIRRKNIFLDHLLARFNEKFNEYVLQLYTLDGDKASTDVIQDKLLFLQEYDVISKNRGKAFDYFNADAQVWNTTNVSGLEHRLSRLLGIKNYARTDVVDEGMFVVENILLRNNPSNANQNFIPVDVDSDCSCCDVIDPYSFRICVVLPGLATRFANADFRAFIERTIRLETPAHIMPRICWVDDDSITDFEKAYHTWLDLFHNHESNVDDLTTAQNKLIDILFKLRNIYPEARLIDPFTDTEDNPFIIGRTNLGTI